MSLVSSMTGSIFCNLSPGHRCRPFALCKCDVNCLDGNISAFSDKFLTNFQGSAQLFLKELKDRALISRIYSGIGYHFLEFDSRTG